MMYIEIDDLVGNSFASYLEQTGNRILELRKIEQFGCKIVEQLESENKKACLRLSRDRTYQFFYEYSDWFTYTESNDKILVVLNKDVSVKDLIKKFSGYLSLDVLLAFRKPENINVLL